ncbi:MAG: ABC transporter substrate-binding protein [Solirubrobacteraceae bacterium]
MPSSMVSAFNKQYPQIKIHQVAGDLSGDVQAAGQVIQNQSSYDMAFLTVASVGQAAQAGVLEKPDFSKLPNITNVAAQFRSAYPWGFPTDNGNIGYAYRKDLISERPTTWREFWQLIPKYSGKVVLAQYDRDVISSSLLGLGYDANSTSPAEIKAATKQVINAKPHLLQFAETNIAKPLAQGAAVLTLDWNTDVAAFVSSNKNIVWVNPREGMTSFLEGWVPVKGTSKLAEVETIMNFFMEPKHYAIYVNPIPCFGTIPAVKPYLLPAVRTNRALIPPPSSVKLYFESYLGEAATKMWDEAWQEIQSA